MGPKEAGIHARGQLGWAGDGGGACLYTEEGILAGGSGISS